MGSWTVNEEYLSLIRLPTPDGPTAARILERSRECVDLAREGGSLAPEVEAELDGLVLLAYGLAGTKIEETITTWAAEAGPAEK